MAKQKYELVLRPEDGKAVLAQIAAMQEEASACSSTPQLFAMANAAAARGLASNILAGIALSEARESVKRGEWEALVDKHWRHGPRWAQRCIIVAREFQALTNDRDRERYLLQSFRKASGADAKASRVTPPRDDETTSASGKPSKIIDIKAEVRDAGPASTPPVSGLATVRTFPRDSYGRRVIGVPRSRIDDGDIGDAYSAERLADSSGKQGVRTFTFDEPGGSRSLFTQLGGFHGPKHAEAGCWRLVPRAEWTGPVYTRDEILRLWDKAEAEGKRDGRVHWGKSLIRGDDTGLELRVVKQATTFVCAEKVIFTSSVELTLEADPYADDEADSPTCVCGHACDEHDGRCMVDDCRCVAYELDRGDGEEVDPTEIEPSFLCVECGVVEVGCEGETCVPCLSPIAPPGKLPRGRCPTCHVDVAVRRGGEVREHRGDNGQACKGGKAVVDTPQLPAVVPPMLRADTEARVLRQLAGLSPLDGALMPDVQGPDGDEDDDEELSPDLPDPPEPEPEVDELENDQDDQDEGPACEVCGRDHATEDCPAVGGDDAPPPVDDYVDPDPNDAARETLRTRPLDTAAIGQLLYGGPPHRALVGTKLLGDEVSHEQHVLLLLRTVYGEVDFKLSHKQLKSSEGRALLAKLRDRLGDVCTMAEELCVRRHGRPATPPPFALSERG